MPPAHASMAPMIGVISLGPYLHLAVPPWLERGYLSMSGVHGHRVAG